MSNSEDPRRAREPTPHPELNAVLAHLLREARTLLGDNFVGAYLQGSFAVGDHTDGSDCDFIIVTRRDIAPEELPAFQAMHAAIHELPYPPLAQRARGLLRAGGDPSALVHAAA